MVATAREKIAGLSLDTTGHGEDDSHPVGAHGTPPPLQFPIAAPKLLVARVKTLQCL